MDIIHFKLVKILAVGSLSSVYLAERLDGGQPTQIVVKKVHLAVDDDQRSTQIKILDSKASILLHLQHPNLVRHLATQFCPSKNLWESNTYDIIMEYCPGGTLEDVVKNVIPLRLLQTWIEQLLLGLEYIHERRIIHRDVKCDNLFLSDVNFEQAVLKIGGLGFFKLLLNSLTRRGEVTHTTGSVPFMAPEMIQAYSKDMNIGRRVDTWGVGCVVIQMITGEKPKFYSKEGGNSRNLISAPAIMQFIANGGLPYVPKKIPEVLDDFIKKCLTYNQDERPRATELLKHHFFNVDVATLIMPQRDAMTFDS